MGWELKRTVFIGEPQTVNDGKSRPVLCDQKELGVCFGCSIAMNYLLRLALMGSARRLELHKTADGTGIAIREPGESFYGVRSGREFGGKGEVKE